MKISIAQVAQLLGGTTEGNDTKDVWSVGKIEEATEGQISFLSNPKYEDFIYTTEASAVIVNNDFKPSREFKTTLIKVDDSYSAFTKLLEEYDKFKKFSKVGIEQPSFIHETAKTGENIYLAAFSHIGVNAKIGNNVKIFPQVQIGDNVTIGDNTILYAGVKIYSDCEIGKNCTIHSNTVVGSDGFGFAPQKDGTYKTIPQIGNVIIKDNVSIGANTVIDCATMGSTIIHEGVKLDNLIQIAHNVEVEKNTVMAAQAGVSGSTKVGQNCIVGGQVGLAGHLNIADQTSIAAQSGLTKGTKKGDVLIGSPAMSKLPYAKSLSIFKNLPELQKRIDTLEEKTVNLPTTQEG